MAAWARGGIASLGVIALLALVPMNAGGTAAASVTWTAPFSGAHWSVQQNLTVHSGQASSRTLISPAFSTRTGKGAAGFNSTATVAGTETKTLEVQVSFPINSSGGHNFTAKVGGNFSDNWGMTPGKCGLNASALLYDFCYTAAGSDAWFQLSLYDTSAGGFAAASPTWTAYSAGGNVDRECIYGHCINLTLRPFHGSGNSSFAGQLWLNVSSLNPLHRYAVVVTWELETITFVSSYQATLAGGKAGATGELFPQIFSVTQG